MALKRDRPLWMLRSSNLRYVSLYSSTHGLILPRHLLCVCVGHGEGIFYPLSYGSIKVNQNANQRSSIHNLTNTPKYNTVFSFFLSFIFIFMFISNRNLLKLKCVYRKYTKLKTVKWKIKREWEKIQAVILIA